MVKGRKLFEADAGVTIPQTIESVPPAVVHTVTEVPTLAHSGAVSAVELPHAVLHETLRGLTTATEALTLAANRLADTATTKGTEIVTPAIESPIEKASEISPEVVPPQKERIIRRNGRKVKR